MCWVDDVPEFHRVELLRLFTATKKLYLSGEVQCIALTLQGLVEERTTELLPALQNLFLHGYRIWGPIGKAIGDFGATRELSGHPVYVDFFWSEE
jgi:hypothetical protein